MRGCCNHDPGWGQGGSDGGGQCGQSQMIPFKEVLSVLPSAPEGGWPAMPYSISSQRPSTCNAPSAYGLRGDAARSSVT